MAPQRAKGRAKMECSHLIISRVMRRLRKTGTGVGYQFSVQWSVVSGQWSERKDLAGVVVNLLTLHCYCVTAAIWACGGLGGFLLTTEY